MVHYVTEDKPDQPIAAEAPPEVLDRSTARGLHLALPGADSDYVCTPKSEPLNRVGRLSKCQPLTIRPGICERNEQMLAGSQTQALKRRSQGYEVTVGTPRRWKDSASKVSGPWSCMARGPVHAGRRRRPPGQNFSLSQVNS